MESKNVVEYNSIAIDLKGWLAKKVDTESLNKTMSEMGADRWEHVETIITQDGGTTVSIVVIFSRESSAAIKYDYNVQLVDLKGFVTRKKVDAVEINKKLSDMGQQGWHLAETINTQAFGVTNGVVAIFKRQLAN